MAATHSYQSSPGPSNLRSSSPENTLALIGLLNAIFQLENPIVSVVILNPFSYQEFAEGTPVVVGVGIRQVNPCTWRCKFQSISA